MTRIDTEIRFAKETLSAYKKRKSRQGIKNGIGLVIFAYLITGFLLQIQLRQKMMIVLLASLLFFTICGDILFLAKTRSKKGCSGLYVLWDIISLYVMLIVCGFEMMYAMADLYKIDGKALHTSLVCLMVSIILSISIELIVDIIYIRKGKLQTKIDNIKGPGGATIYAIVTLFIRTTPSDLAPMPYFLIGIIAGAGGAAMIAKIFYRLYLIKKHNLWDYFGRFDKNTPYDTKEGFGL